MEDALPMEHPGSHNESGLSLFLQVSTEARSSLTSRTVFIYFSSIFLILNAKLNAYKVPNKWFRINGIYRVSAVFRGKLRRILFFKSC